MADENQEVELAINSEPDSKKRKGLIVSILFIGGILSVVPYLVFLSPFPETESFALYCLAVVFTGFVYLMIQDHKNNGTKLPLTIIAIVLATPILYLVVYGYVVGINGLYAIGEHEFSGTVSRLYHSEESVTVTGTQSSVSRSAEIEYTVYWVEMVDETTNQAIELSIKPEIYEQLEVGQHYSELWNVGLLGLVYRYQFY